jgi:hypothetical protein
MLAKTVKPVTAWREANYSRHTFKNQRYREAGAIGVSNIQQGHQQQ